MAEPPEDPRPTDALPSELPASARVRECRLTVRGGERDGTRYDFRGERTVVGAHASADFVIDDPSLSKFHCEIHLGGGTPTVRDLGSLNGTYVDQVPITLAPLRSGALLRLGRTQLEFTVGARHFEIPLYAGESFGRLLGRSIPMRALFAQLVRAAASDCTVLLQGETGTGKDLAAESIHQESARAQGPFVVFDCAAIAPSLMESALFGHEAGAFTGASATRIGALEAASGGTLFFDEIGELPLELQPKLLRAIERREVQRVGGTRRIAVDVRILAATNRQLREEVNARRFRSDLYFRLAVLTVTLPPLRERTVDLPLLVGRILESLAVTGAEAARLRSDEFMAELLRHPWPGNVRELRNYVEARLVQPEVASSPATRELPAIDLAEPLRVVRDRFLRFAERRYLEQMLAKEGGNVSAAARAAGLDRVHFHRLLARHGLR